MAIIFRHLAFLCRSLTCRRHAPALRLSLISKQPSEDLWGDRLLLVRVEGGRHVDISVSQIPAGLEDAVLASDDAAGFLLQRVERLMATPLARSALDTGLQLKQEPDSAIPSASSCPETSMSSPTAPSDRWI